MPTLSTLNNGNKAAPKIYTQQDFLQFMDNQVTLSVENSCNTYKKGFNAGWKACIDHMKEFAEMRDDTQFTDEEIQEFLDGIGESIGNKGR